MLRKRPKSHFDKVFLELATFLLFLDVFSDTSLEYPQGVVWKNLKISFSALFHIFNCFEQGD